MIVGIRFGFFDSVNGDRKYPASWFNEYFRGMIGEGVFPNPSNGLQIIANGTKTVTVKPGKYWHKDGYWLVNDTDKPFTVPTADVTYPRFDSIVIQLRTDVLNRKFDIVYKTGIPAATPTYPAADKTATSEFTLGYIYVARNATAIGQDGITDKRTKVAALINTVDTTTLYNQYQTALDKFLYEKTAEYEAWFAGIQETLGAELKHFTKVYITTVADETVIPIGIPEFVLGKDVLTVYVNGIKRTSDQFTISSDGKTVTLAVALGVVGTPVEFDVVKIHIAG